jgi:RNA polymerase sigma factor (sigma-70 family)
MEQEALFLSSLPVIDRVALQVCRRHRLNGPDAEDFCANVRLHFIQDECRLLRRFQGRCALATYVNVVVQRLYLDQRNAEWGRWRPSAEAKRGGPVAILFERLVVRDGWTPDTAAELMRLHHGIDGAEVAPLVSRLSRRTPPRRFVGLEEALELPAPDSEDPLTQAERTQTSERVQAAAERAMETLAPEDRLILRMRFEDALPVATIARVLQLDQKRLYRTIERILKQIRAALGGLVRCEQAGRRSATSLRVSRA